MRLSFGKDFDRFHILQNYKEKEMADFRRWVLAIAALTLVFTGLASAQVVVGTGGTGAQMSCSAFANPNTMRNEGWTEQIGDIYIYCTGGTLTNLPPTTPVPVANITVLLPKTVTSRLSSATTKASEAVLLIDEPGSTSTDSGDNGVPTGFGSNSPLIPCTSLNGASATKAAYLAGNGCGPVYAIPSANGTLMVGAITTTGSTKGNASETQAPNMYVGVVSGNTVTFQGISVAPPVSAGIARVFRITNVRMDAIDVAGGSSQAVPVAASFTISPPAALTISNVAGNGLTVGYVTPSLTTKVTPANPQQLCLDGEKHATVSFTELFGTAFKTRFDPAAALNLLNGEDQTNGIGFVTEDPFPVQNTPGFLYQSESGFVPGVSATLYKNAGIADFGTRLRAIFSGIPDGVTVIAALRNNDSSSFSSAALVATDPTGEAVADSSGTAASGDEIDDFGAPEVDDGTLTISSAGTAEAVWEVVATQPNVNETYAFDIEFDYSPNTNVSTASVINVALSYAPITASATAKPLAIPRFGITGTNATAETYVVCQTALLFPYVVFSGGYDTGIAISNTSADPWDTVPQQGHCAMYFYTDQGDTPVTTGLLGKDAGFNSDTTATVPDIPAGSTAYMVASNNLPSGFIGYGIAICDFQFAHGFAIIENQGGIGAGNFASGYVALVMGNSDGNDLRGSSDNRVPHNAEALEK